MEESVETPIAEMLSLLQDLNERGMKSAKFPRRLLESFEKVRDGRRDEDDLVARRKRPKKFNFDKDDNDDLTDDPDLDFDLDRNLESRDICKSKQKTISRHSTTTNDNEGGHRDLLDLNDRMDRGGSPSPLTSIPPNIPNDDNSQINNGDITNAGIAHRSVQVSKKDLAMTFPDEVWYRVISHLDPMSRVCGVGSTCRRLRRLAANSYTCQQQQEYSHRSPGRMTAAQRSAWERIVVPNDEGLQWDITDKRFVSMLSYGRAAVEIDLDGSQKIGDMSMVAISHAPYGNTMLRSLNICGCEEVTDAGLTLLRRGVTKLTKLSIGNLPHVDEIEIAKLIVANPDLKHIHLTGVKLTHRFVEVLQGSRPSSIDTLVIDHCPKTDGDNVFSNLISEVLRPRRELSVRGMINISSACGAYIAGNIAPHGLKSLNVSHCSGPGLATMLNCFASAKNGGGLESISINFSIGTIAKSTRDTTNEWDSDDEAETEHAGGNNSNDSDINDDVPDEPYIWFPNTATNQSQQTSDVIITAAGRNVPDHITPLCKNSSFPLLRSLSLRGDRTICSDVKSMINTAHPNLQFL